MSSEGSCPFCCCFAPGNSITAPPPHTQLPLALKSFHISHFSSFFFLKKRNVSFSSVSLWCAFLLFCLVPFLLVREGKKEAVKKRKKNTKWTGERRERGVISLHFSLLWPRLKVQLQREKKKKIFGWKVIYKTPQWKTKKRVESEQKRNGWSWMRDSCCCAHNLRHNETRTKKSLSFFVGWDFTHTPLYRGQFHSIEIVLIWAVLLWKKRKTTRAIYGQLNFRIGWATTRFIFSLPFVQKLNGSHSRGLSGPLFFLSFWYRYYHQRWRHSILKYMKEILTSWLLDPCGDRHWIRNRIRWVLDASRRWGCPRWTPTSSSQIKTIKQSKVSSFSSISFLICCSPQFRWYRHDDVTLFSVQIFCANSFYFQVDQKRSLSQSGGVELQSKRDAENRTILGRSETICWATATTTNLHSTQSPKMCCSFFLISFFFFQKGEKVDVTHTHKKHTHTHTHKHWTSGICWIILFSFPHVMHNKSKRNVLKMICQTICVHYS